MIANQHAALCCRCRQRINPGDGRFVGKGLVMHRQPCKPPAYLKPPSTKKMLKIAKDFLAP